MVTCLIVVMVEVIMAVMLINVTTTGENRNFIKLLAVVIKFRVKHIFNLLVLEISFNLHHR
jgi:hypothetical protein